MKANHSQTFYSLILVLGVMLVLRGCTAQMVNLTNNIEYIKLAETRLLNHVETIYTASFNDTEYIAEVWGLTRDDTENLVKVCKVVVLHSFGASAEYERVLTSACKWLYHGKTPDMSVCKPDLYYYCFKNETASIHDFIYFLKRRL